MWHLKLASEPKSFKSWAIGKRVFELRYFLFGDIKESELASNANITTGMRDNCIPAHKNHFHADANWSSTRP